MDTIALPPPTLITSSGDARLGLGPYWAPSVCECAQARDRRARRPKRRGPVRLGHAVISFDAMRRLFLLRHAKSSWKDRELADHDRPLAPRGRRATKLIAEHLRQQSVMPAVVLCSSARRTLETLERISPALGEEVSVHIERELYAASEQSLLERLRGLEDGVESVLVIGHNPGLERLV
ncbi:MAG: SixA phosphatase family protein, partial [Solirubrobacteraceae bacterium]